MAIPRNVIVTGNKSKYLVPGPADDGALYSCLSVS